MRNSGKLMRMTSRNRNIRWPGFLPAMLAALLALELISACGFARQPVALSTQASAGATPERQPPGLSSDTPTSPPTATHDTQPVSTPTLLPTQTGASTPAENAVLPDVKEFPNPQDFTWQPIVTELNRPVGLVNAGDGSGRLFVIEQRGRIKIIQDDSLAPEPFLDIHERIEISSSEQGLLGLAFHPQYAENGYFFVNYTDLNGNTVIARFRVSTDNPNKADAASEERLLFIEQPYPNHNGGGMAFGPDGFLYLGLGDGGAAGDPQGYAQDLTTHLGKLLRIEVNGATGYTIPPDNPFPGSQGLPEIWAYGLRNPWRFSFDRQKGALFIGDVGQNAWEEIDYLPAGSPGGLNFGWDYREGMHEFEGRLPTGVTVIDPVAEYDHSQGCSVTGGVVYRGLAMPEWYGVYFFGDFCSGRVWGLIHMSENTWAQSVLYETGVSISAFGEDESGEIYLVDYNGGVYQLVGAGA